MGSLNCHAGLTSRSWSAAHPRPCTLACEVGEDLQIRGTVKAALVGSPPESALPESAYSVVIDEPFVRAAQRKRLRQV